MATTPRMAAGIDPLAFMMRLIGGQQKIQQDTLKDETKTIVGDQTQTGKTTTAETQATTGTTTGTSKQQTAVTADIAGLQEIFAKQAQGVTPDALAAIFQQGSRQAPAIIHALANALGARSVNNDPVATALGDLGTRLAVEAQTLNQQMLGQASDTAARIADATRAVTTTAQSAQDTSQQTSTNQLVDALTTLLTNQTQKVAGTEKQNTRVETTINTDNALKLLLGGLGVSAANQALPQGIVGSLSELLKGIFTSAPAPAPAPAQLGLVGTFSPEQWLTDLLSPAFNPGTLLTVPADTSSWFTGSSLGTSPTPSWWTAEGWDKFNWTDYGL